MKIIVSFIANLVISILVSCISLNTFASFNVEQTEESQIKSYVEQTLNNSFEILNDSKLDETTKISKVKNLLSNNLDAKWMGRFVLGRAKIGLTEDKLSKFDEVYAKYIVKYYSNGVKLYNGQMVQIVSFSKRDTTNEFLIKTYINQNNGEKLNINYMVRRVADSSFKIFDVIAENVSLLSSQKSEYTAFLQDKKIDELISFLESKL